MESNKFVIGRCYLFRQPEGSWTFTDGIVRITDIVGGVCYCEIVEGIGKNFFVDSDGIGNFHINSPFAEVLIPVNEHPEINSEEFLNLIG